MPILRLAYATQLMIALIAVFVLWSQVGGQSHLDLMPWYLKLGLGGGVAIAAVRATMCAVSGASGWNGGTLKWFGIMLALCFGCGLVTYYYHVYEETDEQDEEDQTVTSQVVEERSVGSYQSSAISYQLAAEWLAAGPRRSTQHSAVSSQLAAFGG